MDQEKNPTHFYCNGVSYKCENEQDKAEAFQYLQLWMKYLKHKIPYDAVVVDHLFSELPPHFISPLAQNPFIRLKIAVYYKGKAKMPLAYLINEAGNIDYE